MSDPPLAFSSPFFSSVPGTMAGLLRLVFLLGNLDKGPGAEERQRDEHRHGDLIQAIILHNRWSPRA